MKHKYHIILTAFLLQASLLFSQESVVTRQQALETFRQGEYSQAYDRYAFLISKYPKDAKINYYFGICELKTNQHISTAIKHLKYASIKGVSKDIYYYLGRAYQLNYNFKEAIESFNKFQKYAKPEDVRWDKAERYKKESAIGDSLSTKIYYLQVVGKDTISKDMLLSMYHPVKDAGYILYNKDFFESGVDPNGILYLTERKDEVYFSMPVDSSNHLDIFKMEKLLDGWGEPVKLNGINSKDDDLYPYLQIDGVTLYFSSNREGGLGGYDIYKTIYDPDSKSFSEPVNMGIPFNSPKDDYFFVTDEFTGVAWFASNRNTTGNKEMVYQIIWDGSVVKNMVYEEKDVKISASMPLLDVIPEKILKLNQRQHKSGIQQTTKELFQFKINDNITLTDFSQFQSKEALRVFRQGYTLQQKKDSLSTLMKEKRRKYSESKLADEKEKLVNEILTLEKQVYGLDSEINDYYFSARSIERPIVERMVKQGTYNIQENISPKSSADTYINEIFIPKEYSYYTDEEFEKQLQKLDRMYRKIFSPEVVNQLKHADSLYVWGNILSLEASKLLEQATQQPASKEIVISSIFKQKNSDDAEPNPSVELSRKGQELKSTALKLYHNSLDKKFTIFRDKIKEIVLSQPKADFMFLEERQSEANAYFRQAIDDLDRSITFNPQQYEKEGALKREAVGLQEEALFLYLDYLDGNSAALDAAKNKKPQQEKVQRSYQEVQGGQEAVKEAAKSGKAVSSQKDNVLEYRIQIGVFRNQPDANALKKIPPVTSVSIPDKGLTKYFAGHYSSYKKAEEHISNIREAGFTGAFIVAFYNGQQIKLSKAKELSK